MSARPAVWLLDCACLPSCMYMHMTIVVGRCVCLALSMFMHLYMCMMLADAVADYVCGAGTDDVSDYFRHRHVGLALDRSPYL